MSIINLNNDLSKIRNLAIQWKMNFNHDSYKQAQEVLFFLLITASFKKFPLKKIMECILILNWIYKNTWNNILSKANKTVGLLHKPQAFLQCQSLVTVYKAFIRPHLDRRNTIYDKTYNDSLRHKLESIQCNATPAIIGAIRGTSIKKLYQDLGLQSLRFSKTLLLFQCI